MAFPANVSSPDISGCRFQIADGGIWQFHLGPIANLKSTIAEVPLLQLSNTPLLQLTQVKGERALKPPPYYPV